MRQLKMEPPKNVKQLRGFVGTINYYKDMLPRRAHVLAPLTHVVGKCENKHGPKIKFERTLKIKRSI